MIFYRFCAVFFFIVFWVFFYSNSIAQIYVGSWNPIRYPNTGVCGWAFQDNAATGTISDPFASIEHALKVAEANGTSNQSIYILPDAYVQRYDYDSIPALDRDNCDGHDLDYSPTVGAALNGLQIIGSTSGCMTFLDAIGTSNALSFLHLSGASNITISNIYFKGYSQAISINNSANINFTNCVFEGCNYGATALDAILINSTSANTTVSFSGCKFIDNTYNTSTNAINIQSNSSTPTVFTTVNFNDCEFVCNQKNNGGGAVFINGRTISNGTPTTVNFAGGIFANNKATGTAGRGGALHIGNNCHVTVDGTYFLNNNCQTSGASSPNDGGGAIFIFSDNTSLTTAARTDVSIANALFFGNTTAGATNGGAIALIGASGHSDLNRPKLTVTNTIFDKNKTSSSAKGGSVFAYYGELSIFNSTFRRDSSGTGGAIAVENAASVFSLASDSFINNSAASGTDIQSDADFTISNSVTATENITGPGTYNWTLIDNFNSSVGNTVGNGWTETETTVGTGALITGAELQLGSTSAAGKDYVTKPFFSGVNPILTSNTETLNWAFNFRQSRVSATGFTTSIPQYAIAFVLAATNSNLTTANGYAVIIQGSLSTNATVRLVSFTGGITNSSWTQIGTGMVLSTDATRYCSVRVVYNPLTDSWSLYAAQNGGSYPNADPRTVSTQIGTSTVNTAYTSSSMTHHGALYSHGAAAARGFVDAVYFQSGNGIGTGSVIPFVDGASMISSYDCNSGYCAAQLAATCLSNQLSNFICTSPDATGSISGWVFEDANGNGLSDENIFLDSVYIILYDDSNNVIARFTTKAGGFYAFYGLPSGTYRVAFTPKNGLPDATLQNQNPGIIDSDVDTTFYSMWVTINTNLTNTVNDDAALPALNFQNVSAGFSTFNYNVLPLELISYKGEINNCSAVTLDWNTTSEFNVDYFEVLKSENGNSYATAGKVFAKGNTNSTNNAYSFDLIQDNRDGYYKLKMVDTDGSYSYSSVLYLRNDCQNTSEIDFIAFPNPATDRMDLYFNNKINDEITITIMNQIGVIISGFKRQDANGMIPLDLNNLPSGNYILKVNTSNKTLVKKILKL